MYTICKVPDVKRILTLSVVIGCAILIGACSSFAYLSSDDYRQAGIRVTTNQADAANLQTVNQWATELIITYSAQDVGVWAANRLAKEGRHDILVLVELISPYDLSFRDPMESENMWRISVYPLQPEERAK